MPLLPALAIACLTASGPAEAAVGDPPKPLHLGRTSPLKRSWSGSTAGSPPRGAAKDPSLAAAPAPPSAAAPAPPPPVHDVFAGAMARAASQGTVHPIDTLKVRLQAGKRATGGAGLGASTSGSSSGTRPAGVPLPRLERALGELGSLYKGVFGAATGAGIIIGAYFAVYSTTKRFLRERTTMQDGTIAFVSGATAAVGSSVIKVPIAVCIRSVQAGVYRNAFHAFTSIRAAVGFRGLFTAFLPTLLEDVPDMAVKFAVYESLRTVYTRLHDGRQPGTLIDLLMGGIAGSAAAACTTPLDVVKTRMMCSASSRPTIASAVRGVMADGEGWRAFFRGVGPRSLSNGLNSAIFFCFFEAIRRCLQTWQLEHNERQSLAAEAAAGQQHQQRLGAEAAAALAAAALADAEIAPLGTLAALPRAPAFPALQAQSTALRQPSAGGQSNRLACLSLALPLSAPRRRPLLLQQPPQQSRRSG